MSRGPAAPRPSGPHFRGVALLAVLWIMVLAALLLATVQQAARVHLALGHAELAAVEAHWLARAGLEQALAVLEDDDATVDSLDEDWADDALLFEKVELGHGTFTVHSREGARERFGLVDESGRLNLNVATREQLDALHALTDAQIDALLDWRSPEDPGLPKSVGRGYYQHHKFPYTSRDGEFQTHREVLLVKGFEDGAFFGKPGGDLLPAGLGGLTTVYSYDPASDPHGAAKVNINSAGPEVFQERFNFTPALAQAVVQQRGQRQFESVMGLLDVRPPGAPGGNSEGNSGGGSSRGATPSGGGRGGSAPITQISLEWLGQHLEELKLNDNERQPAKLNINTAPRDVLMTLPELTREVADGIIARRSSATGGFCSVGELYESKLLDERLFRALAEKLTVRSNVFSIQSTGVTTAGARHTILAVVDRGTSPIRILYWYQSE